MDPQLSRTSLGNELYNYESYSDNIVLDCSQHPEEDLQPILREEVEIAVAALKKLKKGKSAGVDNIPAEIVQSGGEPMIDVLTKICDKIWKTGEWPTPWTQSLIIILPKKGNLQLCQNYRTISLISHPSKVMPRVDSNPKLKRLFLKNRLGSEPGEAPQSRSSTSEFCVKSTFNISRICTMTKTSICQDMAWSLIFRTMRKYNINANLFRAIEHLYDNAISAVHMNGSTGE